MSFNAKKATGGGGGGVQQATLPVGNYPARLVQLIDLGLQPQRPWQGEEKAPINMIRTTYELPSEFCLDDKGEEDKEKPRWMGEEMPFYNLAADRARSTQRYNALDPTGACDGEWSALIEGACTLTVVHNPGKGANVGKVYANIGSTAPAMKGFDVPPLVNPSLVWSLDDPDMEVFNKFPDFIQEKIKGNLNFIGSILESKLNGTEMAKDNTAIEGADVRGDAGDKVENPYG